jgi:transcriptional regulator with XRE-family HTH domain
LNDKHPSKQGASRRNKGTYLPYLADLRRTRGLTQERLSALSGVSRESIYRLEGGRRGAMPDTLWKLALALGVSPEDLIYAPPWWWRLSQSRLDRMQT